MHFSLESGYWTVEFGAREREEVLVLAFPGVI